MKTYAPLLLIVMALTACQKPAPPKSLETPQTVSADTTPGETLQNIEDNLAQVAQITSPKNVVFDTVALGYQLPKAVQTVCQVGELVEEGQIACPVIKIELAKSKPEFIAQTVNRAITNDDNPKLLKFKKSLDEFALEQVATESATAFYKGIDIERLPDHKNLVQIAISTEEFMGGAHGMSWVDYKLFDTKLETEITLDDLLLPDIDFYGVLDAAYDRALLEMFGNPDEITPHKESYPLEMTNNVHFSDAGLEFVYQPYELGPYMMGNITLVVPFAKLQGVIKPEYL